MQIGYPHSKLLKRLSAASSLSGDDQQRIARLTFTVRNFAAGQDVVRDGEISHDCWLLVDGYLYRHKETKDGRRQILSLHVPGDIPDLASLSLPKMDHTLSALGGAVAAHVAHDHLHEILAESPALTRIFQRELLIDSAIGRGWILNIGTRQAVGRVAHLLCEVATRLRAVGLAQDLTFPLPMSQSDIGEATGMSTVHANRVVQELRALGVIEWRNRILKITDWDTLAGIADFSPEYLHLKTGGENTTD